MTSKRTAEAVTVTTGDLSPSNALPQISPPRQKRSRATMERVLTAFAELIQDKPFEHITMAEISARAKASLPSIYARFEDKNGLLLAVHEQFKQAAEFRIDLLFAKALGMDAEVDRVMIFISRGLCRSYTRNRLLLSGALLSNSPVIYERAAQLVRRCSELMTGVMMSRLVEPNPECVAREADFAVRAAFALLQQRVAFADVTPSRFRLGDTEMDRRIGDLFVDALRRAAGGAALGAGG